MAANPFDDYEEMVHQLLTELETIRSEGADIKFQGVADRSVDAKQRELVAVRFAARSKGAIERLNCRTDLPACGIRRVVISE